SRVARLMAIPHGAAVNRGRLAASTKGATQAKRAGAAPRPPHQAGPNRPLPSILRAGWLKGHRIRRIRCGTSWTRSTPCAPLDPGEQAVVLVSAERARGDACGTAGRTLRQESGAGTRWAARTGRPSCRMGRRAARREAAADLD